MSPLLAAGIAGLVAVAATVAVERLGGRVGGVLATIPTTIVPASVGLWTTTDATTFQQAMATVPAGMCANAFFLWLWGVLPARGHSLPVLVTGTLLGWLVGATAAIGLARTALDAGVPPTLLCVGTGVLLLMLGLVASWHAHPAPPGSRRVGAVVLLLRGLTAATAIGVAVLSGRVAGGVVAGVATVFPAIFLTTMVAVRVAKGAAVQQGAVGPMILGTSCVPLYAVTALLAFPAVGPWVGAAAAWIVAVVGGSVPIGMWLARRASRPPQGIRFGGRT